MMEIASRIALDGFSGEDCKSIFLYGPTNNIHVKGTDGYHDQFGSKWALTLLYHPRTREECDVFFPLDHGGTQLGLL